MLAMLIGSLHDSWTFKSVGQSLSVLNGGRIVAAQELRMQFLLEILLNLDMRLNILAVWLHAIGTFLVNEKPIFVSVTVIVKMLLIIFFLINCQMVSILLLSCPSEGLVYAVLLLDLLDELGLELPCLLRQVINLLHVLLNLELRLVVLILQSQVINLDSADFLFLIDDFLFVFGFEFLDSLLNRDVLLLKELVFLFQLLVEVFFFVERRL